MTQQLDAQTAAQIAVLVEAQAHARKVITDQTVAGVVAEVKAFKAWHDHGAITRFAASLAQVVAPRQRIMAATSDAYLSRVLSVLRGRNVRPAGPVKVDQLRKGTTLEGSYGRLADYNRWLESQGMPTTEALARTVTRAEIMAETDITLANVHQAARTMDTRETSARIDGFRRVLHPELSAGGTCGLCVAASDRVYHVQELMPIHARCQCEALPIVNGVDPGHRLNEGDLTKVYGAAGGTHRKKLARTRWTVNQHGELGPVLGYDGQSFRGPTDIPNLEPTKQPANT